MISLEENAHRVVIQNYLEQAISTQKTPFIIFEDTEVLKIVEYVLKNIVKVSYVKLSDHRIYVLI